MKFKDMLSEAPIGVDVDVPVEDYIEVHDYHEVGKLDSFTILKKVNDSGISFFLQDQEKGRIVAQYNFNVREDGTLGEKKSVVVSQFQRKGLTTKFYKKLLSTYRAIHSDKIHFLGMIRTWEGFDRDPDLTVDVLENEVKIERPPNTKLAEYYTEKCEFILRRKEDT